MNQQVTPETGALLGCLHSAYTQVRLRRLDDPHAMPTQDDLRNQVERDIVSYQNSVRVAAEDASAPGSSVTRREMALRKIERLEAHVETLCELRSRLGAK